MKRLLMTSLAILLTCGAALAEPQVEKTAKTEKLAVRTFHFNFKEADKAAAAIKQLISGEGSISIQPSSNSLVVTDRPDNLKQIAQALADFDKAARGFHITVRLIGAARVEGSPRLPDELSDLAPSLAMLRYNSYESMGNVELEGHEGEPGIMEMQNGYRADFRIGEYDQMSDTVKVNDFRLSKLQGPQHDQLTQVLNKTSLNLKLGQTLVLGASKGSTSQKALMLVIVARQ
jgi:hypothetical protein